MRRAEARRAAADMLGAGKSAPVGRFAAKLRSNANPTDPHGPPRTGEASARIGRPARRGATGADPRAGFTLIEVLAALAVTSALVAVVLPYAGRLATHWWVGEATVEGADGWMQAVSRLGDDLAQALPYGVGGDDRPDPAFQAGPESIAFVRPALGGAGGLDAVTYEIRPSAAGSALVRRSRAFDPSTFGRDVGGTSATLLDGPFRLRLVEVARDGTRRRAWSPADGMPSAVELSAAATGAGSGDHAPVPVAPVLMPVVAQAPAAAKAGGSAP